MRKIIAIAIFATIAASCTTSSALYDWKGYDNAVYAYTKTPDEGNTAELIKVYNKLIQNSGGTSKVPPPGVCADYGYLLIKSGKTTEGRELLVRETQLYPESKPFIDRILKRFEE